MGNQQAQEKLYEKYSKIIKDFINKQYPFNYDIDDDVSEVMIKIFTKLDKFDANKSKFKSWVFSVAKNHMIDKWRNNAISLTGNISMNGISTSTTNNGFLCNTTSNTMLVDNGNIFNTSSYSGGMDFETSNSLSFIADQLTPRDYTLLDMKYVQGYDYKEIGLEFNITSSTVSNRVNYIKTKLKKNNPEIVYD